MTRIFISHSSADNNDAERIKSELNRIGYNSVFLDFDPEDGIDMGRRWEKEIFRNLRSCDGMVVLCSESMKNSSWCLAEITIARFFGKLIFPVNIDGVDLTGKEVSDTQTVLDHGDWEDGILKLAKGMASAGLDPTFSLSWEESKTPYPGLDTYEEDDAGVFFGRTDEINQVVSQLNSIQLSDAGRFATIVGPSGCGKSSFVRAGVYPQLRRRSNFTLLPPIRPGLTPLETLSQLLSNNSQFTHSEIDQAFSAVDSGAHLLNLVGRDLVRKNGALGGRFLLFVDQWEELYSTNANERQVDLFCQILRSAIIDPDSQLNILVTLRSDFLLDAQQSEFWQVVNPSLLPLEAIPRDRFARIIEEPARKAGVELESGLVTKLIEDAGGPRGLPLLAFALRELYLRDSASKTLKLSTYQNELGGVRGAIAKCVEQVKLRLGRKSQTKTLRNIFVRLADVDEDGRFTRRSVPRSEFNNDEQLLLDELYKARLLSMQSQSEVAFVEVTHESLFTEWPQLEIWLDEIRGLITWFREIKAQKKSWENAPTIAKPLFFLSGGRLDEAKAWISECEVDVKRLDSSAYRLIQDSILAADRAKKSNSNWQKVMGVLIVFAISALIGSGVLWSFLYQAQLKRDKALSDQKVAELEKENTEAEKRLSQIAGIRLTQDSAGYQQRLGNPGIAAVLLGNALADSEGVDHELEAVLRTALAAAKTRLMNLQNILEIGHDARACSISPTHDFAVIGNSAGRIFMIDLKQAEISKNGVFDLPVEELPDVDNSLSKGITDIAFHPSGDFFAVATAIGRIHFFDTKGNFQKSFDHPCWPMTLEFDSTGKKLLVAGHQPRQPIAELCCLATYETNSLKCMSRFNVQYDLYGARFMADGERILAYGAVAPYPALTVWSPKNTEDPLEFVAEKSARIFTLAARPNHDGEFVTGDVNGEVRMWRKNKTWESKLLLNHGKQVRIVSWGQDGNFLLVGGEDARARLWDVNRNRPVGQQLLHRGQVRGGAVDLASGRLLTVDFDEGVHIWDLAGYTSGEIQLNHPGPVWDAAFNKTGEMLITSYPNTPAETGGAIVWKSNGERIAKLQHGSDVMVGRFRPGQMQAVTCGNDGVIKTWDLNTKKTIGSPITNEGKLIYAAEFTDPNQLAVAGRGPTVRLFSSNEVGEELVKDTVLDKPVNSFVWRLGVGTNGLLASDGGRNIYVWKKVDERFVKWKELSIPRAESSRPTEVIFGGFNGTGTKLLSLETNGNAYIWDLKKDPPMPKKIEGVSHVAGRLYCSWNRQRDIIAISSPIGVVSLWKPDGERWSNAELIHPSRIECLEISPDGKWLITGCIDGGVRLWSIDKGVWTGVAAFHNSPVTRVKFNPSSKSFLSASRDGTAKIIQIPTPTKGSVQSLVASVEAASGIKIERSGKGASATSLAPLPLSRNEFLKRRKAESYERNFHFE